MIALPPPPNRESKRRRIIRVRLVGPRIPTRIELLVPFFAFALFCLVAFLAMAAAVSGVSDKWNEPLRTYSAPPLDE